MRPIIDSTFATLDGVVNHMETWHFDFVDHESDALALEQLLAADALIMGRKTYEAYAMVWPDRSGEYADRINAMPKYVVSSTLRDPVWSNTTVLSGEVVDEIAALKDTAGGPLLMHGFGPVATLLLGAGLLDELHIWVHPRLVGVGDEGDRLHTPGLSANLHLRGTRAFESGVVVLSYEVER